MQCLLCNGRTPVHREIGGTESASRSGRAVCQIFRSQCNGVGVKLPRARASRILATGAAAAQGSVNLSSGEIKSEVDVDYQACSNYLRSLGIENRAELARVLDISTNPNSLFHTFREDKRDSNPFARKLDVEKDLKPLVEYLQSEGLSQAEVCKIIIDYPAVLCYSPDERLRPFFEYLRSLGIEAPHRTVLQRPSLLGLTADRNLRRMVDYLQQNDYTTEQIERLLATSL